MKTKMETTKKSENKFWLLIIPVLVAILMYLFYGPDDLINIVITMSMSVIGTAISWHMIALKKDETLQSIWTSLGILGTFIALLIAFKDTSLFGYDKDGLPHMAHLLSVLSSAFTTSIIGITAGIFFYHRNKIFERKKEKGNEYYQYPPEKILFDIKIAIENISSNISQDITKLMIPFFQNMNSTVLNNLQPTFTAIENEMKEMVSKLNEQFIETHQIHIISTEKLLGTMKDQTKKVSLFGEQIEKALGELVGNISESLEKVFNNNISMLNKVFENLKNWQYLSKEQIEALTSNVRILLEHFQNSIELLKEASEISKSNSETFKEILEEKEGDEENSKKYLELMTRLSDKVQDLSKAINLLSEIDHKLEEKSVRFSLEQSINN